MMSEEDQSKRLSKTVNEFNLQVDGLQADIKRLTEENRELKSENKELEEENQELKNKTEELEEEKEEELEAIGDEKEELEEKIEEVKNKKRILKEKIEELKNKKRTLKEENEDREKEIVDLEINFRMIEQKMAALELQKEEITFDFKKKCVQFIQAQPVLMSSLELHYYISGFLSDLRDQAIVVASPFIDDYFIYNYLIPNLNESIAVTIYCRNFSHEKNSKFTTRLQSYINDIMKKTRKCIIHYRPALKKESYFHAKFLAKQSDTSTEVIITSANMLNAHITDPTDVSHINHDTACLNTISTQEFNERFIKKLDCICKSTLP